MRRNPPSECRPCAYKAALGGLIAVSLVALAAESAGELLAIAPLAASCVLVFAAPESPMAQPANVIGGHVLSTVVALLLEQVLPGAWWAAALGVGCAILAMSLARVTHPPAGADAFVVLTGHPGWGYLIFPILLGSMAVVAAAVVVHRALPPRRAYPLHAPQPAPEPVPQPD